MLYRFLWVALAGAAIARELSADVAASATGAVGLVVVVAWLELGARFGRLGPPRTLADVALRIPFLTCSVVLAAVILGGWSDGWRWALVVWMVAEAVVYVGAEIIRRIRDFFE